VVRALGGWLTIWRDYLSFKRVFCSAVYSVFNAYLLKYSCADILFLANNTLTDIVFLIVIAAMVVRIEYTV
jgi:hypothetical protein